VGLFENQSTSPRAFGTEVAWRAGGVEGRAPGQELVKGS
jgi:hypothetical protein